jgi:TatD DNase family protein
MIDTHSHLYVEEFDEDRAEVINRAREAGVQLVLLPAIDSRSHPQLNALCEEHSKFFKGMMGVHPCSVKPENWKEELQIAKNLLDKGGYVAVGEIGVDLYWDKTTLGIQQQAFAEQITWAKARKLPIVIHCREAFNEIFEVLDTLNDENLSGVFHCFTGNSQQAEKALLYQNFMLGIGGVLTFKNSGLDKVVADIPLQHLVLETDSPYLAPLPFRGKRNESAYTALVAQKLAEVKQLPLSEIVAQTTANAKKMFQL